VPPKTQKPRNRNDRGASLPDVTGGIAGLVCNSKSYQQKPCRRVTRQKHGFFWWLPDDRAENTGSVPGICPEKPAAVPCPITLHSDQDF